MTERWCLIDDDDGHWYVIPAALKEDFKHWVYGGSVYEQPEWVWSVNGHPNNVTFASPEIFGNRIDDDDTVQR